jgi:sugar phosphate permease
MLSVQATALRQRYLNQRVCVFAGTWLAYAGFYLCRKNFSVVMPFLQNDAGLSKIQLADILFAYSLAYTGGQFVMGDLADRFTARLVVGFGLATAVAANMLMAVEPGYWPLLILGMLNGLAQSTGWPGLVKVMGAWFPAAERGVVMAWWSTNYVLGGLLATVLASALVAAFAWRTAFWIPALLLAAVTVLFLALVSGARPAATSEPKQARDRIAILRRPMVWLTAAVAFLLKVMRYSFLYWLPLYLTDHLQYRPDQAGYLSSVYELLGFGGAVLAGYASDRLAGGRRFPVSAVMLAGLALSCFLLPGLAAVGWVGSLTGIMLVGFFTYGPDTLMQGAASQDAATEQDGAATAGLICGIASIGQLAAPYLVATVATRRGWDELFYFFVGTAGVGALLSVVGWKWKAPALG